MKSDRWKQIEKLYYAASKLDVSRRAQRSSIELARATRNCVGKSPRF